MFLLFNFYNFFVFNMLLAMLKIKIYTTFYYNIRFNLHVLQFYFDQRFCQLSIPVLCQLVVAFCNHVHTVAAFLSLMGQWCNHVETGVVSNIRHL